MKDTLPAIVEKLTAVRLVNSEMRIPLSEARREYYLMVAITVANIPLLYFINQEWYEMLMYSVVGKLVLAITALVILITAMRTARLTKPIELFQQLFYVADHEYGGCLPVPVHFLMDEFANGTQLYR